MQRQNIDSGNAFDWGKTSQDYGKFRDIYPLLFYQKIVERNCGTAGQEVLDIGTGTGVLPRNMYQFGAHWTGSDIAPNQIAEAKRLSAGMEISYLVSPAEELDFAGKQFDCICQSKGGSGICKASEAARETVSALHGVAAIFRQDC